jgi:hypothetical protein
LLKEADIATIISFLMENKAAAGIPVSRFSLIVAYFCLLQFICHLPKGQFLLTSLQISHFDIK